MSIDSYIYDWSPVWKNKVRSKSVNALRMQFEKLKFILSVYVFACICGVLSKKYCKVFMFASA